MFLGPEESRLLDSSGISSLQMRANLLEREEGESETIALTDELKVDVRGRFDEMCFAVTSSISWDGRS